MFLSGDQYVYSYLLSPALLLVCFIKLYPALGNQVSALLPVEKFMSKSEKKNPENVAFQFNSIAITICEDEILCSASFTVCRLRSSNVKLDFVILFCREDAASAALKQDRSPGFRIP
jgi:hypothetical protein